MTMASTKQTTRRAGGFGWEPDEDTEEEGGDSMHTDCLTWTNIFCIVIFYVSIVVLLKGMGESFLLSKDEPLTPNIDRVMALWIFERSAQKAKGENWTSQS